MTDSKTPRTHRWFRREQRPRAVDRPPEAIQVDVPAGAPATDEALARAVRDALAGWPVCVLRVVAAVPGPVKLGRNPGRWVRQQVGRVIDEALWTSPGPRASAPGCGAYRLLGRHNRGPKPDGEAWAALTVRAGGMPEATTGPARLTFELAIAGRDGVATVPALVDALLDFQAPDGLHFPTVQYLSAEEELRWRKADPDQPPVLLPLDRLDEPKLRPSRLVLAFVTPTPMTRKGETGRPHPELTLVVDRMTRSFGAWMGRTGHRGPRLPVDDLLRAAAQAQVASDLTRTIELPGSLVAAEGGRDDDDRVDALVGEATYTGAIGGLLPLLRAAHWVGMGPGRQHGLGQVALR